MAATRTIIASTLLSVAMVSGVSSAGPADAAATIPASTNVYASDDAYTSSLRRTFNFGRTGKLLVGRTRGEIRTSYVKFTVGAPAAGTRFSGAELRLPLAGRAPSSTLTLLRVVDTTWSQRSLTAARAPGADAVIGAVKLASATTTATFDVSKVVTRPGVYSFALKSSATNAITLLRSREYGGSTLGGAALRLKLAPTKPVPTTPVPTTPVPTTPVPTKPVPTTPVPTTPVPTTPVPTTPVPTTPPVGACVTDHLLVPSCGVLWGAAAGAFTTTPRDVALRQWEAKTGRTSTIFHQYHKGDEKFPNQAEIAMTRDPARPRVLMLNWQVAQGSTWAKVAAGEKDARLHAWVDHIKANYPEKFFLALHHEPENEVVATTGSGMTAKDYAAMYRHVVTLLRTRGVHNAINVVAYMGNERWMAQPWWADLYPGDAYVDWIGLDSYVSVERGYHYGKFNDLLERRPTGGGVSWIDWATTAHPAKPIMVAEWGVYHRKGVAVDKSAVFDSVLPQLMKRPQIKAIVYFDTEADNEGDRNISVGTTPNGLASFRRLAADPIFKVTLR